MFTASCVLTQQLVETRLKKNIMHVYNGYYYWTFTKDVVSYIGRLNKSDIASAIHQEMSTAYKVWPIVQTVALSLVPIQHRT